MRVDVKTGLRPAAVADSYTVAAGTTLSVPAASGTLANDSRGVPAANLTFYGGGSLGGAVTDHAAGTTTTFGTGGSLTVNADGSLAFTPASGFTGTFTFSYRIANLNGTSDATVAITAQQAPAFTSANATTFTVGAAGTFTVTASGSPAPTLALTSGTLPSGVTFNAATGVLSGTPGAGTAGTYALTFTASNGVGANATQAFTLTVTQGVAITSANSATFTVGAAGTFTVTTSATPTAGTITFTGTLPAGVTFTNNGNGTATLAGTPGPGTGGTYPITITASNGVDANGVQGFTLTVNQPPAITSANATTFTVGNAGTFSVTTTGFPNATLSVAGALPSGVTFTNNGNGTATLAGTPANGTAGSYPLTITASNGVGADATQAFTLTVNQGVAITSANATTFTVGIAGSFTITTSSTPTATTITSSGALPAGVTFTNNGNGTATLAGTPGAGTGGTYPITITASNGVGPNGVQGFTLTVNQAPAITSGNATTFTVGSAGTFTVTATGFPAPTLGVTGALPTGVTLNSSTGVLSGTPAAGTGGIYPLTFTASNGVGSNATQGFTLTVNQAPAITSANATTFTVGGAGTFTVTATGSPAPALSLTGALPAGVTFNPATGILSGTPGGGTGGIYPLTFTASNGVGANATQSFTLTVTQAPAITSGNAATFIVGGAGTFTVTTTGFPVAGLSSTGALPSGVTFTNNGNGTATLAGTPATGTGGSYPLVFTASNGVGSNATQSFTLTVQDGPLATADAYSMVHDTVLTVPAPGVLGNDSGVPAPAMASVTGTGAPCVAFPCTVATTSGSATVAADGSFTYTPAAGFAGTDGFAYSISNVSGTSSSTVTITVTSQPPVVDLNGAAAGIDFAAAFTEAGGAVAIVDAAQLTITDPETTQSLASATITITNLLDGTAESLAVTCPDPGPGCSGAILAADVAAYNTATGTLTITRAAPLADYQALLRTLTYNNASLNPTTTARVVSATVVDSTGVANTPLANANITIAAVNNAPTITAPLTATTPTNVAKVFPGTISVADVDAGSGNVLVTLTSTNGTATLATTAGLIVTGNGTASVSSTGPIANQNAALNGLSFAPTPAFSGAASLKIDIDDQGNTGSGGAMTATKTVAITVDNPPTVTTTVPTNGATGVLPTATITVSFSESVNATTSSFVLECPAGTPKTFTLSASPASSFTVTPSASLPTSTTCTFKVVAAQVTDGIGQNMAADFNMSFTTVQAPVVTASGGSTSFTEGGGAVVIDAGVTVTDADSANLQGGTVSIATACAPSEDQLIFVNQNGITGSYNSATCVLTLTGTSTVANYQAALRSVTYNNISVNPSTTTRSAAMIVNDGTSNSNTATKSVTITAVNSAPVLANGSTLAYTENDPATAINTVITVGDVDSANLAAATVSITGNFSSSQDVLSFTNTASIIGSYNSGTGVLTLTGTDTVANYQAALRAVKYNNTSDAPSTTARTVSYQVNDGSASNNLSNVLTSTVNVTAVNDAPVLANGATLAYTENDPAAVINGVITVADVDSSNIVGATVSITANFQTSQDVLSFATLGPISGSYNAATGVLTLTGTDTLANYQAALRTVKYNNTSENPSTAARTVTFQVNDGGAANNLSNGLTSSINITAVNDAPVLANGGTTLGYIENGAAAAINTGITVTDPDSTNLASATIQITGNCALGEDVLSYVTALGITGSYSAATCLLTLTGATTVANYQTALRNVLYSNTSDNPSTASRTVSFRVNDGAGANNLSNIVTSTVTVTAVNDAPTATGFTNLPAQAGIPITYPAGKLGGTDPEGTAITIDTTPINVTNGTVTINLDGSFTFTPLPLAATASFQYRVTDSGSPAPPQNSAYATVSFAVTGPAIFFVKNPAVGSGNCTLGNECLFATAITNIGATTNASIFIGDANSHTAGSTLNSGGEVIGQGMSATFDSFFGIGAPAQGTLAARPTTNLARPTVTAGSGTTLTVGSGNTLRGFNLGNTAAAGTGVLGTNFGTLTASEMAISTTGAALNLTTGVGAVTLDSVTSGGGATGISLGGISGTFALGSGTLSGNSTAAIALATSNATVTYSGDINAGTASFRSVDIGTAAASSGVTGGTVTFSGRIGNTNSTGNGIRIRNSAAGTITFSGTQQTLSTGANNGVELATNSGSTIQFSGGNLDITTTSGSGFSATGGGTVNVTGSSNTIGSTTGTAVSLNGTGGTILLTSVSANGAASGISLTNTTGSFTVTGTGTADSGGTIQNTTGSGIVASGAQNVSLTRIRITNPGNHGIDAPNLKGTCLVANSTIENFNFATGNGINIVNNNNNLTLLTVSATTIQNSTTGNDGIFMEAQGTSSMALSVEGGSLFTGLFGDGVQVNTITGATGTVSLTVKNSTFNNAAALGNNGISMNPFGGPVTFTALVDSNTFDTIMRPVTNLGAINMTNGDLDGGGPTATFTIQNNTINNIIGSRGISITADTFSGPTTLVIDNNSIDRLGSNHSAVNVNFLNNVTNANVKILNNRIGQAAALWTAGPTANNAVLLQTQNSASMRALVQGNLITANASSVFELLRFRAISTSSIDATVSSNTLTDTDTTHVEMDASTGTGGVAGGTICLNASGNTLPAAGVGRIQLNENASGTINVTQASQAALSTANNGATVSVVGTPAFGQPACTLPP